MQRRRFLQHSLMTAAAAAASSMPLATLAQQGSTASSATLTITGKRVGAMPIDFTGTSFEAPQLYNPGYYSAANKSLVEAYSKLSRNGILRCGGHLSDVTLWRGPGGDFASPRQTAGIEKGKTYWEWKLTDPTVRDHRDGAITPESIRALKGFLDATNWRLIYGFNFGCGSPERAADEAQVVAKTMGDRLLCFQVGNEDDQFAGMPVFRDRSFNFDTYYTEYKQFVDAVHKVVPNAKFAGPDVAGNMSWVQQFAEHKDNAAIFISSHFYAMGPASNPGMDAARLLGPNQRLESLIPQIQKATEAGGLPYRMTEGNSCFGGGKPNVSDAYASALWGADYMLQVAAAGYRGVNLHGGGDGYYTPIAVGPNLSTELRPLYFGMQFADQFAGADLLECTLATTANVRAYAGQRGRESLLGIINKGDQPITVKLEGRVAARKPDTEQRLTGPSLDAHENVRFEKVTSSAKGSVSVPAYTGVLLRWS